MGSGCGRLKFQQTALTEWRLRSPLNSNFALKLAGRFHDFVQLAIDIIELVTQPKELFWGLPPKK